MSTLEGTPNPEAPNPQLPIVQKLRIRYAKRGRLRFTSHRDFCRAFERAVRRADVPIGFSSGYSPHPKISYANASPTGAGSEAEYLEIGLTRACDPDDVRRALDDSLPPGLDVLDVVVAGQGSLADRLQASVWRISLPGVDVSAAQAAVDTFLVADRVEVERMTKRGIRTFDARGDVLGLTAATADEVGGGAGPWAAGEVGGGAGPWAAGEVGGGAGPWAAGEVGGGAGPWAAGEVGGGAGPWAAKCAPPCAILTVVLRHDTPSVRPDDVLAGLRSCGGLQVEQTPVAIRSAQGPLDDESGMVGDPLALDRDAS